MMSDAPAHHLFCLLGPVDSAQRSLPEVLVVLQICLEGEISSTTIDQNMQRGKKAAGDLIPWNISEQFNDKEFPKLAGARIVRIATNPNYQRVKYFEIIRFYVMIVQLHIHCRWVMVKEQFNF